MTPAVETLETFSAARYWAWSPGASGIRARVMTPVLLGRQEGDPPFPVVPELVVPELVVPALVVPEPVDVEAPSPPVPPQVPSLLQTPEAQSAPTRQTGVEAMQAAAASGRTSGVANRRSM
jgi:hypothetical protein